METSAYHSFQSAQAKEEYLASYHRSAKAWPIASEMKMMDIFGKVLEFLK